MDLVRSLCYIEPWMGHVIDYCIGWVLDRALRTKETMSDFVKFWIPINRTQRYGIELHDIHKHSTS